MTSKAVYNVTNTPVAIDPAGRTVLPGSVYLYDDATINPAAAAIINTLIAQGALTTKGATSGGGGVVVPPTTGGATLQDVQTAVTAHEIDPTPHPAYDDLPSFALIFENGLI